MIRLPRFTLREMIMATAIVALAIALWLTWQKLPARTRPGAFAVGGAQTTIEGPLKVTYRERTGLNSTSGSDAVPCQALHFLQDSVVLEYANGRHRRFQSERLEQLSWQAE